MRAFEIPLSSLRDTAALAIALAVLNFVFFRQDLGWWKFQPTPYVLLPILIGLRYGIGAGIVGAAVAYIIPISLQAIGSGATWFQACNSHWNCLSASLLLGTVCGLFQYDAARRFNSQVRRGDELAVRVQEAAERAARLCDDIAELENFRALRDREQSSLETGLRWLSASRPTELGRNLLTVLSRHARVTDAAVYYSRADDGSLECQALQGREDRLPPRIDPLDMPAVHSVLGNRQPGTVPELRKVMQGKLGDYLASVPLVNSRGEAFGLVLVTGIPESAFNPKTLSSIEFICRCASSLIELKDKSLGQYRLVDGCGENCRIYTPGFFTHLVATSCESAKKQQVHPALILFCAPEAPPSFQPEMERTLMRHLRSADYASQVHLEAPHLVVLLPVTARDGAPALIQRVRAAWFRTDYHLVCHSLELAEPGDLESLLANAERK